LPRADRRHALGVLLPRALLRERADRLLLNRLLRGRRDAADPEGAGGRDGACVRDALRSGGVRPDPLGLLALAATAAARDAAADGGRPQPRAGADRGGLRAPLREIRRAHR